MIKHSFKTFFSKNMLKITVIVIGGLFSTLGIRTELAVIFESMTLASYTAIAWVTLLITILSYIKTKEDEELQAMREREEHRRMLVK